MKMEPLERSKNVVELGKKLVDQLDLSDDLTAQWMAHYIAERIEFAEKAEPLERAAAQASCAEAIFMLWERRNCLPARMRPFRELDPLLQTLSSINVETATRFRYMSPPSGGLDPEDDGVSNEYLKAAIDLDYSARVLVHYLLSLASENASEAALPWLNAAMEAGANSALEIVLVEFSAAGVARPSADERAQRTLMDKIERLEHFSEVAAAVAADLRRGFTSDGGVADEAVGDDKSPTE